MTPMLWLCLCHTSSAPACTETAYLHTYIIQMRNEVQSRISCLMLSNHFLAYSMPFVPMDHPYFIPCNIEIEECGQKAAYIISVWMLGMWSLTEYTQFGSLIAAKLHEGHYLMNIKSNRLVLYQNSLTNISPDMIVYQLCNECCMKTKISLHVQLLVLQLIPCFHQFPPPTSYTRFNFHYYLQTWSTPIYCLEGVVLPMNIASISC